MATGTVKYFDEQRGFGFITRDGAEDLFVHATQIAGEGRRSLEVGQNVQFEIGPSRKGGEEARSVSLV